MNIIPKNTNRFIILDQIENDEIKNIIKNIQYPNKKIIQGELKFIHNYYNTTENSKEKDCFEFEFL